MGLPDHVGGSSAGWGLFKIALLLGRAGFRAGAGSGKVATCVFLLVGWAGGLGCDSKPQPAQVRVLMADSLHLPFREVQKAFEAENPDCRIVPISSGSVMAARRIIEAGDRVDVLAVADHLVIEELLRPRYADWYIGFASNEVVIVYTDASRYAAEVTSKNWYDVLFREGVTVGAANPYHDPCGYWAELCWQLADRHYKDVTPSIAQRMTLKCGSPADRRSDTEELLQLLESAAGIDYAFVYRSQAQQHHLPWIRLPPEISLGSIDHLDAYRQVSITLPGTTQESEIHKRGEAVIYAVTIPKTAEHRELAARFVRFLLGPRGREILRSQHVSVTDQPWTFDLGAVPRELHEGLQQRPRGATRPSTSDAH
jgi:molybdate/tungstate transport system substrate-binding protein